MRLGVCGGVDAAAALRDAGFSFIETNVQAALKPEAAEEDFAPMLETLRSSALPVEAANCFLPGHLKVTGPDVNSDALRAYATTAFARAARVGIRSIVFGSGGARRIPDGFDRDRAWAQLIDFGRMIAPLAQANGVTIAVEPLNRGECNVLNSVTEGAAYVRDVDHPAFRLLVDAYHWDLENESTDAIVAAGDLLRHVHISTYRSRKAPGLDATDYGPFFGALRQAGYDGRVSVEAGWNHMATDAPTVAATLCAAAGAK